MESKDSVPSFMLSRELYRIFRNYHETPQTVMNNLRCSFVQMKASVTNVRFQRTCGPLSA